jgi:hypothetical protein
MSAAHLRLLRRVAAQRRKGVRSGAIAPADMSEERLEQLTKAISRADAQLRAATDRRRRRAGDPAASPAKSRAQPGPSAR